MTATESTQIMTVTDSAAAKVNELISGEAESDTLALRIQVKPGGCSGFSYDMFFDSEVEADDNVTTLSNGVRILIDNVSTPMLQGASLDYADGLQATGFHIENPNASRTCGCGNSFS